MRATELITYAQPTTGGKYFKCSRRTAAHLDYTKKRLEKEHPGARLEILQGCYHVGYEPSAGTHDKDKVLDVRIVGLDWWTAQAFLRSRGWAAWYRHTGSWSAPSEWHIHMISLGGTTDVGIYVPGQVDDYYRHTYGLKDQHNTDLDKSWFPGDVGPGPWPTGTPADWKAAIDKTIFDFALWERELEDDMPWTDWSKKDRDAMIADLAPGLAPAIAKEVVKQLLVAVVDGTLTVRGALTKAANGTTLVRRLARGLNVDVSKDK